MEHKPKKIKNMSMDVIMGRVQKMVEMREEFMKNIDSIHVKLQQGNSKTGKNVYTVSFIPIADCSHNCKECKKECYDVINVCFQPKDIIFCDECHNIPGIVQANYTPEIKKEDNEEFNVKGNDYFQLQKQRKNIINARKAVSKTYSDVSIVQNRLVKMYDKLKIKMNKDFGVYTEGDIQGIVDEYYNEKLSKK